jgi:hypothetical protein
MRWDQGRLTLRATITAALWKNPVNGPSFAESFAAESH